jgi:hypothetical protein
MRQTFERGHFKSGKPSAYFYKLIDTQHKKPYIRKPCQACGRRVMMQTRPTACFCSKSCSQQGENNSLWKGKAQVFQGTKSEYVKCHELVRAKHGAPLYCQWADKTCKGRLEWCNVSGNYEDPDDYIQLCRSHHIRWDSTKGGQ